MRFPIQHCHRIAQIRKQLLLECIQVVISGKGCFHGVNAALTLGKAQVSGDHILCDGQRMLLLLVEWHRRKCVPVAAGCVCCFRRFILLLSFSCILSTEGILLQIRCQIQHSQLIQRDKILIRAPIFALLIQNAKIAAHDFFRCLIRNVKRFQRGFSRRLRKVGRRIQLEAFHLDNAHDLLIKRCGLLLHLRRVTNQFRNINRVIGKPSTRRLHTRSCQLIHL